MTGLIKDDVLKLVDYTSFMILQYQKTRTKTVRYTVLCSDRHKLRRIKKVFFR